MNSRRSTRFQRGDFRGAVPWFAPDNRAQNLAFVTLVKERARRKGAPPSQIARAWLMAHKPWIVPIPGTTEVPHLPDNFGVDSVRFTPAEFRKLGALVGLIPIHGARLPAGVLELSGVEAREKLG